MSQITQEQIRAELRRRGVSEREIGLSHMDDKHKEYEEFLKTNVGLQGDPAYQDVLNEYRNLSQQRAQAFSDFQAQKADNSSPGAKADALGRGIVEGVGQVAALPVEAVNASPRLLKLVPGGLEKGEFESFSEDPLGGSKDMRRVTQGLGLGYYKQNPSRLGLTDSDEPAQVGDMPPSTRPFAVAGEEIGAAAAFAAPIAMAAKGKTALQIASLEKSANPVSQMVAYAAKNPLANAGLESTFAVLSGAGAGVAESVAPGDSSARMIGAVATPLAPIAIPGLTLGLVKLAGGQSLEKLGTNLKIRLGDTDSAAAKLLQQGIIDAGGDPTRLANSIESFLKKNPQYRNKQTKGDLSPGMITNDPSMLAVERTLIETDKQVKKTAADQSRKAIIEMDRLYNSVLGIKGADPELLRIVADARKAQLNAVTGLRVKNAVDKANILQSRLQGFAVPGVPQVKEKTARQIKKIFDDTHTDLRTTENQLWNRVDRTLRVTPTETEASLLKIASEPEGMVGINLTDGLRKLTKKTGNTAVSLQSDDLLKARSEISSQIRAAMKGDNPNRDLARRLHDLETSIVDDLRSAGSGTQLDLASDATRNRYEFLYLPPVQQMWSKGLQSNLKKPDLVLDSLLKGKQQKVYQTFDDIMQAGAKGVYQKDMRDPLARFYYAMANETIADGSTVDLTKLGTFLKTHEQGLKDLGIFDDLKKPEVQAHLVKRLEQSTKKLKNNFETKSLAGRVLKTGRVDDFIGNILSGSEKRYIDLRDSVNLARKHSDPSRALEGIQQSVVENLIQQSTIKYGKSSYLSGNKLLESLSQKQGKRTLEQDLVSSKLLTKKEMDSIKAMANRAKDFEESLMQRASGEELKSISEGLGTDAFVDIVGRLAGATLASQSILAGGAPSLIVAHIGSQAGRKFLDKMPTLKLREILTEAMLDPVFMKALLEKPTSATARGNSQRKIKYLLASKGLLSPDDQYQIEDPEANTQALMQETMQLARAGKNKLQIMDLYEEAARKPNSDIGPYMLDQVQSLVGVNDEQRARIMKQYEDKKMDYFLKRRGRFQEKENPQAMFP